MRRRPMRLAIFVACLCPPMGCGRIFYDPLGDADGGRGSDGGRADGAGGDGDGSGSYADGGDGGGSYADGGDGGGPRADGGTITPLPSAYRVAAGEGFSCART